MLNKIRQTANIVNEAAFYNASIMLRDFNEIINLQTSSYNNILNFTHRTKNKLQDKIKNFIFDKKPNLQIFDPTDKIDPQSELYCMIKTLDGIENFQRGIPFCCNILVLYDGETSQPVYVLVDNPILKESFHAIKNFGSWFENNNNSNSPKSRMRVSNIKDLSNLTSICPEGDFGKSISLGCTPIEISYLSSGRIDLIYNNFNDIFTKACLLLVKESGGFVKHNEQHFIASNGAMANLAETFFIKKHNKD